MITFLQWLETTQPMAYRGVKINTPKALQKLKIQGLTPDWIISKKDQLIYPVNDISKPYLFWTDQPEEGETYGTVLTFPQPPDSILVNKGLDHNYYVTPNHIPPNQIYIKTDYDGWHPLSNVKMNAQRQLVPSSSDES